MLKRLFIISSLLSLRLLIGAEPALAVQAHGGAEGLVSHQIGHLLFTGGMAYLLFRVYRFRFHTAGWFEFKIFLWLILGWNILTFTGHWLNEFVSRGKFVKSGDVVVSFTISNFTDLIFYLTRLDHLLLVPACIFLLLTLRKWRAAQ